MKSSALTFLVLLLVAVVVSVVSWSVWRFGCDPVDKHDDGEDGGFGTSGSQESSIKLLGQWVNNEIFRNLDQSGNPQSPVNEETGLFDAVDFSPPATLASDDPNVPPQPPPSTTYTGVRRLIGMRFQLMYRLTANPAQGSAMVTWNTETQKLELSQYKALSNPNTLGNGEFQSPLLGSTDEDSDQFGIQLFEVVEVDEADRFGLVLVNPDQYLDVDTNNKENSYRTKLPFLNAIDGKAMADASDPATRIQIDGRNCFTMRAMSLLESDLNTQTWANGDASMANTYQAVSCWINTCDNNSNPLQSLYVNTDNTVTTVSEINPQYVGGDFKTPVYSWGMMVAGFNPAETYYDSSAKEAGDAQGSLRASTGTFLYRMIYQSLTGAYVCCVNNGYDGRSPINSIAAAECKYGGKPGQTPSPCVTSMLAQACNQGENWKAQNDRCVGWVIGPQGPDVEAGGIARSASTAVAYWCSVGPVAGDSNQYRYPSHCSYRKFCADPEQSEGDRRNANCPGIGGNPGVPLLECSENEQKLATKFGANVCTCYDTKGFNEFVARQTVDVFYSLVSSVNQRKECFYPPCITGLAGIGPGDAAPAYAPNEGGDVPGLPDSPTSNIGSYYMRLLANPNACPNNCIIANQINSSNSTWNGPVIINSQCCTQTQDPSDEKEASQENAREYKDNADYREEVDEKCDSGPGPGPGPDPDPDPGFLEPCGINLNDRDSGILVGSVAAVVILIIGLSVGLTARSRRRSRENI